MSLRVCARAYIPINKTKPNQASYKLNQTYFNQLREPFGKVLWYASYSVHRQ